MAADSWDQTDLERKDSPESLPWFIGQLSGAIITQRCINALFIALRFQWNAAWQQAAKQKAGEATTVDTEQMIKDEAEAWTETCSLHTDQRKQQQQQHDDLDLVLLNIDTKHTMI